MRGRTGLSMPRPACECPRITRIIRFSARTGCNSIRDEVQNLAADPASEAVLLRLKTALKQHTLEVRDLGFLPENDLHSRSGSLAPYEMGQDSNRYPLERILNMAELAAERAPSGARRRSRPQSWPGRCRIPTAQSDIGLPWDS